MITLKSYYNNNEKYLNIENYPILLISVFIFTLLLFSVMYLFILHFLCLCKRTIQTSALGASVKFRMMLLPLERNSEIIIAHVDLSKCVGKSVFCVKNEKLVSS